jgi:hypothetical protein
MDPCSARRTKVHCGTHDSLEHYPIWHESGRRWDSGSDNVGLPEPLQTEGKGWIVSDGVAVRFVACCIYLSAIPKFSSARPVSSVAGGNVRSSGSASAGGNRGSGCGNLATAADVGSSTGRNGGDGSRPTAAVGEDGTPSTLMAALVQVPEASSSLQTAGRPMAAKRKSTMGAAESGNGKLARAVDSIGRAIAKRAKSRERVANFALQYRLIRRAGLKTVEQQAAYRQFLTQTKRNFDGDGSEVLDGDYNAAENNESNIVSANT